MGIALSVVALAPARAQDLRAVHFTGSLSDYSPSTVSGAPYEIRGNWSLDVVEGGTATFSADLNMETSDYGITGATQVDPADPATRSPHTYHWSCGHGYGHLAAQRPSSLRAHPRSSSVSWEDLRSVIRT
jgi:hypothetical protein